MRMRRAIPVLFSMGAAIAIGLAGCGGGGPVGALPAPVVQSIDPPSGGLAGGTGVSLHGAHLANAGVGANQVLFDGQPATDVIVVDDGEITCITPPRAAPGAVDVTVVKEGGAATVVGGFTYFPPPTIAMVVPNTGTRVGGQPVSILGTGFLDNAAGTNEVRIGNKPVTNVVVVSDGELTGITPSSYVESPVDVTVENRNGLARRVGGYVYGGPPPFVTSVVPAAGSAQGGTPVTILGGEFTVPGGPLEVRFGANAASSVVRVNDGQIQCIAPPGPPNQAVDVTVSNNNGPGTLPGAYYYIGPPTLTSVSPTSGTVSGGTLVTLTGSSFQASGAGTTTVRFGGVAATSVTVVDDAHITCVTPRGLLGLVDVEVENGNGSDLGADAYEYTFSVSWDATFGSAITNFTDVDDGWSQVTFTGGFTFPFFGVNQSSVFVNSNGNLTFGVGDSQWTPSVANLTNGTARLSAFWSDLSPAGSWTGSGAGAVYVKQLTDRLVVTWSGVPEFPGPVPTNTFQVVLHDSGIACFLYQVAGQTITTFVGISPGGSVGANQQDLSTSPAGFGAGEAVYQDFTGSFDIVPGTLVWAPNATGGFDVHFTAGPP